MGCPKSVPVVDSKGTTLPSPPSFWQPVDATKPRAGADARSELAKARANLKRANKVIVRSKAWYLTVRRAASGGK